MAVFSTRFYPEFIYILMSGVNHMYEARQPNEYHTKKNISLSKYIFDVLNRSVAIKSYNLQTKWYSAKKGEWNTCLMGLCSNVFVIVWCTCAQNYGTVQLNYLLVFESVNPYFIKHYWRKNANISVLHVCMSHIVVMTIGFNESWYWSYYLVFDKDKTKITIIFYSTPMDLSKISI